MAHSCHWPPFKTVTTVPLLLHYILFNTWEAILATIQRWPRWIQQNTYRTCSLPTAGIYTPNVQQSINTWSPPFPTRQHSPLPSRQFLSAPFKSLSEKTRSKDDRTINFSICHRLTKNFGSDVTQFKLCTIHMCKAGDSQQYWQKLAKCKNQGRKRKPGSINAPVRILLDWNKA